MASRPRHRLQRAHYDVDATITPETGIKVSVKQMGMIAAGAFIFAVGYAFIIWGQQETKTAVTEIRSVQTTAIATTTAAIKDQDDKRSELGKKFLESNDKIAAAVNSMATQLAVQQERQKSTDEKLEKVLTQISTTLSPPGSRR